MKTSLQLFKTGYCVHPEKIALKDASLKSVAFPAMVGLIKHDKHGYILFDTGYSEGFFKACNGFPYFIYPKITPVTFEKGESIKEQLFNIGILPDDISYIVISHFHGDHIGGLLDFPKAKLICTKKSYYFVKDMKGITALKNAFLPDLIPHDFLERVRFLDDEEEVVLPEKYDPFSDGWDVFGDGSVYAVDLTGHAIGQIGIFLTDQLQGSTFLCADACWQSRAYRERIFPHFFAYLIIPDPRKFNQNLLRLHQLYKNNPEVKILPTHCSEIWEEGV